MKLRKVLSVILIITMLTTLLVGCGKDTDEGAVRTDLRYALKSEPSSLDNVKVNDLVAFSVLYQIYDTLIVYETSGELTPGLAESWEIIDDGKTVRFYLREGVKFHNGETMTAEDVAFSLNRSIASPFTSLVTSCMENAEVVDEMTVDLHLKSAYGPILYCIANAHCCIVSKKAVEEVGEDNYGREPVGSGAYKFVEWQSGDYITLTANEDYWKGEPSIKDVTFKIYPDLGTAAIALEGGDVDLVDNPTAADRDNLVNNEDIAYYETEQAGTYYLAFNNAEGFFTDEKVRQAVSHAIDKEAIVLGAFEGNATAIDNPVPPSVFGYNPDIKGREYDVEKAKQLMAESSYPDGFTVNVMTPDDAMFSKATEIIQSQLKEIGIDMKIEKMERGAWMTKFYFEADYQMGIGSLIANYPDFDYEYIEYHSSQIGINNYFLVNNPELDKYFDIARVSVDEAERQAAYDSAVEIIIDDAVICPLFMIMNSVATDADLKGVQPNPINRFYIYDYSW